MYYKIDRTYVTDADGRSARQYDVTPILVPADNAPGAIASYLASDGEMRQLGNVTALAGDKAVATLSIGRRVLVVFVQRAAESLVRASQDAMPARDK